MRPSIIRRIAWHALTLLELVQHLTRRRLFFFVPFVLVLLLAGAVLLATEGLSYVAPFVYTLF